MGDAALMVLHEIYTNIFKHADTSQPYDISISINNKLMQIDSHNTIASSLPHEMACGNGMQSLNAVLSSNGGSIRSFGDKNIWQVDATIPLAPISLHESK